MRRLRGFQRVTLGAGPDDDGQLDARAREDVGFYDNGGRFRVENGTIEVYAGDTSSESDNKGTFRVTGGLSPKHD